MDVIALIPAILAASLASASRVGVNARYPSVPADYARIIEGGGARHAPPRAIPSPTDRPRRGATMAPPPPQSRENRVKKSRSLEGEGEGGYFDTNEDVDSGVSIWSVPIYPFELILGPTPRPLTLDDARDVLWEAEIIKESRILKDLSSSDTEGGGQRGTTSLSLSVELTLSEVGWSNPGGALETID